MMNYDFSKPQRQSASGIIIMAASYLYQVIKAMIIPIVILFIKMERDTLFYWVMALVAITIGTLIISYLSYRRFTFFLNSEKQEFIINKGIFNRTLLTIQLDKIQQVNINQSFLQKIIGVYSLQIDTPGGDANEVAIKAIDEEVAYSLKEHLLNGQKQAVADDVEDEKIELQEQTPFLKLSPLTLFKVGLTSNYGSSLLVLTGFMYAIFHNAKDLLRAFDTDNGQVEAAIKTGVSLLSVGILVAIFLCVLLIINITRTFIKYFDFEVSKHKRSLLLSSGLFAKKNTLLSPEKVQITAYSQNYFQKKFNLLNLTLRQADSGRASSDENTPKTQPHIPGCNSFEKDEILMMILDKLPEKGTIFTPNYRFLNLPIFFRTVIPLGTFLIFMANFPELKSYLPLAIIYAIVSIFMIYMSYRKHRLTVTRDFIIKKSGIWDISNEIIVPRKIQAITTFQYPWHKGVDVGHVEIHTAAGIIHFKYGNYTEIKQLVNYWLYQVESGSEEWM